MKYAWIQCNKNSFPITAMCGVLGVSKSGYYKSLDCVPSIRAQRTDRIRLAVKQVHHDSHQTYGSHKIAQHLEQTPSLESACRNTVAKAMREMGLKSCVSKKFASAATQTDSIKTPAPNVLNQESASRGPTQASGVEHDCTPKHALDPARSDDAVHLMEVKFPRGADGPCFARSANSLPTFWQPGHSVPFGGKRVMHTPARPRSV